MELTGRSVSAQFDSLDDLTILDVEPTAEAADEWANEILDSIRRKGRYLIAADYDGTYVGNPNGINILIERTAREDWYQAVEAAGCVVTAEHDAETGHYGDNNWDGVDIVRASIEYPEPETVYLWLER